MTEKRIAYLASAGNVRNLISEEQFQETILDLAELYGWLAYHTHDSRKSAKGFPDLTLVREGRLIFAELKTEKGALSPEQATWGEQLMKVEGVEYYLWRPRDWETIERALGRGGDALL